MKWQSSLYIHDDLNVSMNPKTLEFSDSSYEEMYHNKSNKDNVLLTRLAMVLTAFLFFIYAVLDPYTYPSYYQYIWLIRLSVILFLAILFIYSFNEKYINNIQKTAFMQIVMVGGGLISMFLFPEENSYKYVFTANYVLIPTGLFVLTGLRFKNMFKSAIPLTLIVYIIVITQFEILNTIYYIFLFTSITVIAIVGAYFAEIYKRKFFLKEQYTDKLLEKLEIANNKLQNLSLTDELTQINNRRSFNEILKREINRARRDKKYITFMMVDIDFFKLYNDSYGHLEGDETLKKVAKSLKNTFQRSQDFVFRLGGEEFGVLLSDSDKDSCKKSALKMCTNIKELKIEHKTSKVNKYITVSAGVFYAIVDDAVDENYLIKKADDALYEAKESGRDRCVFI